MAANEAVQDMVAELPLLTRMGVVGIEGIAGVERITIPEPPAPPPPD